MSAVVQTDPHVFQGLAFRADVIVLLGYVGELLDAIETTRPIGIFFHPDVRSDAAFIEPLQKLPIAVGGICRQCLRQVAVAFAISFDHGTRRCALVTQSCRGSLHTHDDATACYPPDSCPNIPAVLDRLWLQTSNPDPWSKLCLAAEPE